MARACPRDKTQLKEGTENGIEVDRCGQCGGAWYDNEELALLEATVADEDSRRGMIDYAKRDSELDCAVCGKRMRAFNYRAYNLELDACTDAHGFWLDANEEQRVQGVMRERVAGLQRAVTAEAAWDDAKRGKGPGIVDKFKGLFGGGNKT
jgi:Zn-finger nucleic acid-binding protein